MPSQRRLLIILPPSENMDHVYERGLSERFPQLQVSAVEHHDQVTPFIDDAEILMTFSPMMADHVAQDGKQLRWIQVLGSGVDGVTNLPSLRAEVLVTTGAGVQATPVSEATLSLMFALSRQMPRMIANQPRHQWERWPSQLLHGRTVGILGVGAISSELARKCQALGMRVIGISSSAREEPGFERIVPRADLLQAVSEFDYFVLLAAHSSHTHHIVDARVLAAMKRSAFLINVARGGILDEHALLDALRQQRIAGAALDVFKQEPLPAQSQLWDAPNLMIAPHLAGLNTSYPQHIMPLLEHNVRCYLHGDLAAMRNIVAR